MDYIIKKEIFKLEEQSVLKEEFIAKPDLLILISITSIPIIVGLFYYFINESETALIYIGLYSIFMFSIIFRQFQRKIILTEKYLSINQGVFPWELIDKMYEIEIKPDNVRHSSKIGLKIQLKNNKCITIKLTDFNIDSMKLMSIIQQYWSN